MKHSNSTESSGEGGSSDPTTKDSVEGSANAEKQSHITPHREIPLPNIVRCLLTRKLATEAPVEPYHLLSEYHWRKDILLQRLEWSWGMKYDSLDLGDESNKIYLCKDWLETFESGRWLLLPTFEILEKLWKRCTKHAREKLSLKTETLAQSSVDEVYDGAETFEYRLIPLDTDLPTLLRVAHPDGTAKSTSDNSGSPNISSKPIRHSHPFDTLPVLISHVKPHFVICDGGPKLFNKRSWPLAPLVSSICGVPFKEAVCTLEFTKYLYGVWANEEPSPEFAAPPRTVRPMPPLPSRSTLSRKRRRSSRECSGPCFYSKFDWAPTGCTHCRPPSHHPESSASKSEESGSDRSDEVSISCDSNDSDGGFLPKAYRENLCKYVGNWISYCVKQVRSQGGWTSQVGNDDQVGGYSKEPARKVRRISGDTSVRNAIVSLRRGNRHSTFVSID
ncbi:hypothetical protein EW146_g4399 [Bondarzewia mesenterica]|uniref:Uncharacterized protein n=1 Tax=Bondarzewia mesenterica TaxID=1095465 RepID=A0A4S4LUM7_9AGAM|nr:hypothetical protein EW146_g4399 [Bondarzewia mesenterica]